MKERNIQKEIEIVETIIRLLNECLVTTRKHSTTSATKRMLKDIQYCELELEKLIAEKKFRGD